jgi:preprotein translocase subunit SecD
MQNRYPLWKYLLVLVISLLGFLYALPNVYGEDPSIQIGMASRGKHLSSDFKTEVTDLLKTAQLKTKSVNVTDDTAQIRFFSTDTQLQAQDVLKRKLGVKYTVAMFIAPATPAWLSYFNATPMKYGLDLRGGIHFLLEVDVDSVVKRRESGIVKSVGQELRTARIRYTGFTQLNSGGILLSFRDIADRDRAFSTLKRSYPDLLIKRSVKGSKYTLQAVLTPSALSSIREHTIEQTINILRNRVNELGVGEAIVQRQGANRVAVDLPGIQDAARAKQILGGTATLEFRLVDEENDPIAATQGMVPVGSRLYKINELPILLKNQVVLSGSSITSAISTFDSQAASPAVSIQLGGGGEALFRRATRQNVGKRLAIVYVESKVVIEPDSQGKNHRRTLKVERVISAPMIKQSLGNRFQITGLSSMQEAHDLSLMLRAGALPTAIVPVEERTVGPSLGSENIRRGLISLQIGMGLILLIMLVYYRFFGVIANIALIMNLVLLVAVLSLTDNTLTLPGIASIVLTVGMAVDANVLIYERIREELRLGVLPQAAIYAGYEKALSTIVDANITTLIVAIVLFAVGSGPVRGFAVVLALGLLTSMLTAITFTRALVNLIYGNKKHIKTLSIGI